MNALRENASLSVNVSGTVGASDTNLTRERSLDVLAGHLARLRPRPHAHPEERQVISNLIEQLENFDRNPDGLRPMILKSIERLSALLKNEN